jgi:D-galactarolactone cycloisomerase
MNSAKTGAPANPALAGPQSRGRDGRSGVRIVRVSRFFLEFPRWKYVGSNAQVEGHGFYARDSVLRIETDAGIDGFGPSRISEAEARQLLGRDPLDFYADRELRSPLQHYDAPLWDLVGKLLGLPVWRLLGGEGPEWVAAYDSSFYFSDLDPAFSDRGVARLVEEVEHSLALGHRAFKLKVGRGLRWMEREAGLRRDIEVLRAVRRAVGPGVRLMADANDGYDPAIARRFLEQVGEDLFWIEEPFPEGVTRDLELKAWLRSHGMSTLLADGESADSAVRYQPYIAARALDVLQGNVLGFGLQQLRDLSRTTASTGISLAPNNWGSFFGFYVQLILGRAVPNLLLAEQDPCASDAVDVSAFELKEGRVRVPDAPGCGWIVRTEVLQRRATLRWRVE